MWLTKQGLQSSAPEWSSKHENFYKQQLLGMEASHWSFSALQQDLHR